MSLLVFMLGALLSMPQVQAPVGVIGTCDPVDGPKQTWTRGDVKETKRRVRAYCKAVKASPAVCAFMDLIVVRESSGFPGVRHTRGKNGNGREHGLGAMGLSLRWHRDKWPGKDEDPMFCTPEVSAAVAHDILWRAVRRYNAANILELQAIYSGRWVCTQWEGKRKCWAEPNGRTARLTCPGMAYRGFSCHTEITVKDLGRYIPKQDRRAFVAALLPSG